MKALVTGASGFLGRALVSALQERGDQVVGLDRAQSPAAEGADPGGVSIQADLASLPHVLDAVAAHRPDVIFHTGALLSALAEADVLGAVMGNAGGTFNVLEAARLFDVGQVVFTSTIATYGRAAGDVVNDDSPQLPSSIYGVTKVYGERLGEYYQSRYGLDFRAIRFPSVIGPGRGDSGLSAYSSLMIERSVNGHAYTVPLGEHTAIPLLYIDDAVRALTELSRADASLLTRRCYLLAGMSPSAAAIAEEVRRQVPSAQIGFRPDRESQAIVDSWPRQIDESAAAKDWGWRAEFDLAAAVTAFTKSL